MSEQATLEDFKQELAKNNGPGQLWFSTVKKLCHNRAKTLRFKRVPPSIFGLTTWDGDDLTQEVFSQRLIGRNQAKLVLDIASNTRHLINLLANEVNITLDVMRIPNQADNVWEYLEKSLTKLGWQATSGHVDVSVASTLTRSVLNLKRLRNKGQMRFSPVFAPAQFERLAKVVVTDFPQASKETIRQAMRDAMTIIAPALSIESVGLSQEDFTKEREQRVPIKRRGFSGDGIEHFPDLDKERAEEICNRIGEEGREIIFLGAAGATQAEIAEGLGVGRTWARELIGKTEESLIKIFKDLQIDKSEETDVYRAIFSHLDADGIIEGRLKRSLELENKQEDI